MTSVPAPTSRTPCSITYSGCWAAPELVARTWAAAKRENDEITEREVTVLLADFTTVWTETLPG